MGEKAPPGGGGGVELGGPALRVAPVRKQDGLVLVDDGPYNLCAEQNDGLVSASKLSGLNRGSLVALALGIVEEIDITWIQAEAVGSDLVLKNVLSGCDRQHL